MYSAKAISEYIIDYCYWRNIDINNIKLQKLLYFVWCYYYNKTGKRLFPESFYAHMGGPCCLMAYYSYTHFGIQDLNTLKRCNVHYRRPVLHVDNYTCAIIDFTLEVFANIQVYTLVVMSQKQGGPWDVIYKMEHNGIIPYDLIKKYANELEIPSIKRNCWGCAYNINSDSGSVYSIKTPVEGRIEIFKNMEGDEVVKFCYEEQDGSYSNNSYKLFLISQSYEESKNMFNRMVAQRRRILEKALEECNDDFIDIEGEC